MDELVLSVVECPIKNPSSGSPCDLLFRNRLALAVHLVKDHIFSDVAGYLAESIKEREVISNG